MASVTHTVKKGETLTSIAKQYNCTIAFLAKINDIPNINLIYVGQKLQVGDVLYTAKDPSDSTTKNKVTTSSKTVKILQFGVQSDTDRTVFATWKWTKSNTKNYRCKWWYATGDGVWFLGNESEVTAKQSVYTAPANATKVKFNVRPISKTRKVNKKETAYWTADWSTGKSLKFEDPAPAAPAVPTVTVAKYKLTASLDSINIDAKQIEFQIVKNDKSVFKTGKVTINKKAANYSCTIEAGNKYKVRCRGIRGSDIGAWSDYSAEVNSIPSAPSGILTCKASGPTQVYLKWEKATGATKYEIQYTKELRLMGNSNGTTTVGEIPSGYTSYDVTGLEAGTEYFFRVRAANDLGASGWTETVNVVVGRTPEAPTTWSTTTTAVVGEDVILYWMHNSTDNSHETEAQLVLNINGTASTIIIPNDKEYDDDDVEQASEYLIDTGEYDDGAKIKWKVRTAGITGTYGEYSTVRQIDVYAPPSLALSVVDSYGTGEYEYVSSMPFSIEAFAGPASQKIIGYHLTIMANEGYETVDETGEDKLVPKDSIVFSKFYDTTSQLSVELGPGDIDLENNISYTAHCVVSMNSGLTAEATTEFFVSWSEEVLLPNAEISYDPDTLTAHIRPYCETIPDYIYQVVYDESAGVYKRTDVILDIDTISEGYALADVYTDQYEDVIYKGQNEDGSDVYFCAPEDVEPISYENATLSVYRRQYDGGFVLIGEDISSASNEYVTDPHPSLNYARYRIVVTDNYTGAVNFIDLPGMEVEETSIIIQWDEDWSNYNTEIEDEIEAPVWAGSMLKLPYNIDISDDNSVDVSLVEYIGRERPVSYYGTQKSLSSTWSVEIEKDDVDTLYALRRLAVWMGDVYVREPSGSGYWANVSVSFSQKHCELTIPVSLQIVRVDGGV